MSEIAEDIRDALLDYQVGGKKTHAAVFTDTGMVQQTGQQRAVYDQNSRLIVSDKSSKMGTYLIAKIRP